MTPTAALAAALVHVPFAPAQSTPADGAPAPLTLNRVLAITRASRPELQAADRRLAAAGRTRSAMAARPAPTLYLGLTGKEDPTGGSEDLAVILPIDLFGRTQAARASGHAQWDLAAAERNRTLADVQTEVLTRFADVTASAALLEIARAQHDVNTRLLAATERRAQEGSVPGIQVERARIEADRSSRTLRRREAEAREARLRLAAGIGQPGEVAVVPTALGSLVETVPNSGEEVHPSELRTKGAEVRQAEAAVRAAKLLGRPEFQVELRRQPWVDGRNNVYPRIQLSLPIFDTDRIRHERAATDARREAAEREWEDARIHARAAYASARLAFDAAREEVTSYGPTLDAARKLVTRSEIGLREGATSFTDALEATRVLREVQEGWIEAQRRRDAAAIELLRAAGVLLAPLAEMPEGNR